MTFYTRAFDVVPGSLPRSLPVEQEFDAIAAGFAAVDAAKLDVAGAASVVMQVRSIVGADTAIASDRGDILDVSGTFTLSFAAAATLTNGWWCIVRNNGIGNVTLDPNGAELIDGLASGIVYPGFAFIVQCTGTAFTVQKLAGERREVLTSGTTWIAPLGVRRARGRGCGSGGGGGRSATSSPGTGGGAGGPGEWAFATVPGTAYAYAIGAAGTAASSDGVAGGAGGSTTFNTGVVTVTLAGGNAGLATATTVVSGGTSTNADINGQGGAGASFGASFGGSNPFGAGGVLSGNAVAAAGFGAGGYGSSTEQVASAGRAGVIILEY